MNGAGGREKIIADLLQVEQNWAASNHIGGDADHWGNIQYPLERFADLADAAVAEASARWADPRFLEVGCGIATKSAYTRRMYGLHCTAFDRDRNLLAEAGRLFPELDLRYSEAENFAYCELCDIVYVNHPFRDPLKQRALDALIQAEMHAGAILIGVNQALESVPRGWDEIAKPEHWPLHGVWRKP